MNPKKLSNNGFSLLEIIFIIILFTLFIFLALISLKNILNIKNERHWKKLEEQIVTATQKYYKENNDLLPKEIGQTTKLTLRTLKEAQVLNKVIDKNKKECNLDKSYVEVFKYSENEYSYLTYMNCPTYNNKAELDNIIPTIQISYLNQASSNKYQAKITITDENRLMNYQYKIYRYNKEIYDSKILKSSNLNFTEALDIDLTEIVPGNIKIEVEATNIFNKTTKTSKSKDFKDTTPPTCIIKEEDKKDSVKTWINTDREITIECADKDGSGCLQKTYSKKFTKSALTGVIEIADQAGNKTNCEVSVYIDKTPPTITLTPDEGTINKENSQIITPTCIDNQEGSGIRINPNPIEITSPVENQKVTFTCTDNVGNTTVKEATYSLKTLSRDSTCEVEKYNSCESKSCGTTELCNLWGCFTNDNKLLYQTTIKDDNTCSYGKLTCLKTYQKPNTCEHKDCGVALYKECWHF